MKTNSLQKTAMLAMLLATAAIVKPTDVSASDIYDINVTCDLRGSCTTLGAQSIGVSARYEGVAVDPLSFTSGSAGGGSGAGGGGGSTGSGQTSQQTPSYDQQSNADGNLTMLQVVCNESH